MIFLCNSIFEWYFYITKTTRPHIIITMATMFGAYAIVLDKLSALLGEPESSVLLFGGTGQNRSDECLNLETIMMGGKFECAFNQYESSMAVIAGDEIGVRYTMNKATFRNSGHTTIVNFIIGIKIYPGDPKFGMRGVFSGKSRSKYYDNRTFEDKCPLPCGRTYAHAELESMYEWVEEESDTRSRVFKGILKFIKQGLGVHHHESKDMDIFYVYGHTMVHVDGDDLKEDDDADDAATDAATDADTDEGFVIPYKGRPVEGEHIQAWLNTHHDLAHKKHIQQQLDAQTSTLGSQKDGFAFESACDTGALSGMFGSDTNDY